MLVRRVDFRKLDIVLSVDLDPLRQLDEFSISCCVFEYRCDRPRIEGDDGRVDNALRQHLEDRTNLVPVSFYAGQHVENQLRIAGAELSLDQPSQVLIRCFRSIQALVPCFGAAVFRGRFVVADRFPLRRHAATCAIDADQWFGHRSLGRAGKYVTDVRGAAETAELAEIESAILVAFDESLRSADGRPAATVLTWIELFDHLSEGCKFLVAGIIAVFAWRQNREKREYSFR